MLGKLLISKVTIGTAGLAVGFSVYYKGYYHPKHIVDSPHTKTLLKELYGRNHQIDREKTCDKIGVIVFDGVCNICNAGINFVDRFEKEDSNKVYVAWAQNEGVTKPMLRSLDISDQSIFDRTAFIEYDRRDDNLRVYRSSSAGLQIATYLRFPLSAGIIGVIVPEPLRDWIYDVIAQNRYQWFGRTDRCQIGASKRINSRFIHEIEE